MIACHAKWSKVYGVFSRPYGLNYHMVYQIVSLGWPIALQVSGELAAMTVAAYLMGLFGPSALAAQQIVGQFTLLFVMISIGLSSAVSILVSHGYGERNLNAITQTCKAGCVFGLMVSGLFALGFLVFPKTLVDFYLNIDHAAHSQLVDYAVYFMMVAVIYTSFDGIRAIFSNTLRGMQDAKTPMKISIFCLWAIGLPCAYIGGFVFSGGPVGLRIGFTICVLIAAPVMVQRCLKKWRMVEKEFQNGSN